ncbi:unnamed protein product, partial [marine sediment metagenome]
MVLNWNIEVILDFIFSSVLLITTIISYTSPKTKKITSLFYIRLSFFFVGLFMFFDGLAILFLSELFSRISGMILFPLALFVIIGINYTIKEDFYSIGLILVCSLGILDFIFSSVLLITTIISYTSPKTKKITSLFYIRLSFFFVGLFMFFDGLAILFLSELFSRISGMILLGFQQRLVVILNKLT